jgi:Xaa-Pro aminopeptidase
VIRPAALGLVAVALARPLAAQIPAAEYAARRDTVAARLGDGVLIAFGAREPMTDGAEYRQLPAFAWLTGYARPNAAFVLVARGGRAAVQQLFEPAIDPRRALYDGFPTDSADLARATGLSGGLRDLTGLRAAVESQLGGRGTLWVVADVDSRDYRRADSLTRGRRFVQDLWAARPELVVRGADALLDSLRTPKSAAELILLRRAIAVTDEAHRAALRRIRPGVNEAELHALTDYTFRLGGAAGPAFRAIIGSGPNSTSYHYRANDRVLRAGEVVVMDIGALVEGYAADVTRTAPVSGRFTPDQAAVYQLVRDAQAAAEREARAGAPVRAGEAAIRAVLARGLARLGLIEAPDATLDPPWADAARCAQVPVVCTQAFLYMAHGPGHGIGLEVHDAGGYSYSPTGRFQAGEVFTIEPGIYISMTLLDMLPDTPKNRGFIAQVRPVVARLNHTGIRIEDDYLVTATGVEWLSRAPREIAEIEAAMRGGR